MDQPQQLVTGDVSEWDALKTAALRADEPESALPENVTPAQRRENAVQTSRELAVAFRAFREKNPESPHAKEAKREEALMLLRAGHLGDDQDKAQREQLVAELRADSEIPAAQRVVVAAFHDNLAVARLRGVSREERLKAFEAAARKLIVEFPELPSVYESLLRIAIAQSEEAAVRVAREMRDLPAPEYVKERAVLILTRDELIGRSLSDVLREVDPRLAARTRGKQVVLYSWDTKAPKSVQLAKHLSGQLPSRVTLIGVNMDADENVARNTAEAERFGGTQHFDDLRRGGRMARTLGLTGPALVYMTDEDGIVVNVSAQRDLVAALNNLGSRL